MASINGISVKGIKDFLGHEGEPLCQGNVYLNGKKIGFWSQDSWGGPDCINLDGKYSEKLLNQAIQKANPQKSYEVDCGDHTSTIHYDIELLLFDFIALHEEEKAFKSALKSGYGGMLVATDGYHKAIWNLPKSFTALPDEDLLNKMDAHLSEAKRSFWSESAHTKHEVKIYRSLDDFNIGDPIKAEEIMDKKSLGSRITSAESKRKGPGANSCNDKGIDPER